MTHIHLFRSGSPNDRSCSCGVLASEECPAGHPRRNYWSQGRRRCRECERLRSVERRSLETPEQADNRAKKNLERVQKYYHEARREAIARYGPSCKCCGESNYAFLTLDHINNDGNVHRKTVNASNLPGWLKRNGWPTNLVQTLCYNCNCAKAQNGGVCPHGSNLLVEQ